MILVLAESALELIPREIWGHPSVVSDAERRGKKPGEILLDRSRHHPAMAGLEDSAKRGRPDVVYQSILAFQYSLLARKRLGKVYVHTRGGYIVEIEPSTRIPKNYNNFVSLVEQLFKEGSVPPKAPPLMKLRRGDLRPLLEEQGGRWVVLHEGGVRKSLWELGPALLRSVVVVGGFPHGDFRNRWLLDEAEAVYRIGDESLDAFQAVCKVVAAAEAAAGLV